jgi:predicted O-linked N-acetylglucosamine transferase (SPINDLY family)
VAARTDQEIADRIHADRIDLVVDLQGHTSGTRLPIIAARPAPLQVSWFGFPGTSGADFIDFILADNFVIPQGTEANFSEAVVRLPHSYFPMDRKREIAPLTASRSEFGLPEDAFVFCSFNSVSKITPAIFTAWMRILAAVPGSVLWLFANAEALENLRREARARGVAPDRLIGAARVPSPEHLARHRAADLMLDSFPYTAHTTAIDALWMGLPILTCAGETMASRVAGSMLHAAGLPELVVADLDAFVAAGIDLATSNKLASRRRHLVEKRQSLPVFDMPRLTRDIEDAYRGMIGRKL